MTIKSTLRQLLTILAIGGLLSIAAPLASAQDQGDKKQDDQKQDDKKKDEKKQEDKKQDEKKEEVDVPALMSEANQLRLQGKFEEAGALYKKATEAAPENGMAWHLYGYCVHANGKLDEAIKLHTKAAEFEQVKGISLYNLGCAYALKKDTEKALEFLNKAADAEFTSAIIMQDSDLESLHDTEEFKKVAARIQGDGDDDDDGGGDDNDNGVQ